jgi:hypothetical protein
MLSIGHENFFSCGPIYILLQSTRPSLLLGSRLCKPKISMETMILFDESFTGFVNAKKRIRINYEGAKFGRKIQHLIKKLNTDSDQLFRNFIH